MYTVVVRLPDDGDPDSGPEWELGPGETLDFGRAETADIHIPISTVSRSAGRITAARDHWLVDNHHESRPLVVESLDGGGEFVKVPPRRVEYPVAFELSRILLGPERVPGAAVHVYAPAHRYADPGERPSEGGTTVVMANLNQEATYFLVLVALCEARLLDGSSVAVPGDRDIAERIAGSPILGPKGLSSRGVQFHIDYMATRKLHLADPGGGARKHWRRAQLVDMALKWNYVTNDHLALLPPGGPQHHPHDEP
ncbi:serine/threonine protein kinase [Yinghuangia soli]|uniref:Serine/threonine protein kinase n=1 Tax=Yinghuangia soli TaxID=2908204 RepID=A0AA41Q8X8_9ACTN|nr:serine/threonine protein kinase [Yinghuangia soli]MCF2533779.1 serine/threonine protein kinase [Yinghuangia soli]